MVPLSQRDKAYRDTTLIRPCSLGSAFLGADSPDNLHRTDFGESESKLPVTCFIFSLVCSLQSHSVAAWSIKRHEQKDITKRGACRFRRRRRIWWRRWFRRRRSGWLFRYFWWCIWRYLRRRRWRWPRRPGARIGFALQLRFKFGRSR